MSCTLYVICNNFEISFFLYTIEKKIITSGNINLLLVWIDIGIISVIFAMLHNQPRLNTAAKLFASILNHDMWSLLLQKQNQMLMTPLA